MDRFRKTTTTLIATAIVSFLSACGGSDGDNADTGPVPLTVPKIASCGAGDAPETALQGQVPAAVRASGFKGNNCNLQLVGQYQGEGGNWSTATFTAARRARPCSARAPTTRPPPRPRRTARRSSAVRPPASR